LVSFSTGEQKNRINYMKQKHNSWPFKEAERLIKGFGRTPPPEVALFQTGFGPSGLPHIGTFAEVARTTWVRKAYEHLSGKKTKLYAFCDDQDGLRKVPDNLPQPEMLAENLGKPLCDIPDPYGCCASFSDHMINKLKLFLDAFGFDYELKKSSDAYRGGDFDEGLSILLEKVEDVLDLILPTLKEENRAGWSPFLPRCESCGKVYTTRVTEYKKAETSIIYECDGTFGDVSGCGHRGETSVLRGGAKMGWKIDWALRWYCYRVHYEMYGKDLIPSAELSSKIVRLMGGRPPKGLFYELFLDEQGEKISKSKGNGVSVEQWLEYAPIESLTFYIFREPRQAKKLYFDMIPRTMDEYLDHLKRYPTVAAEKRPDTPLWHIHGAGERVPSYGASINFTMVNNLISALGQPDKELLWSFLTRYDNRCGDYPEVIDTLIEKGLKFYKDHIEPNKQYREPTESERKLFLDLAAKLEDPEIETADEKSLQALVFDVARNNDLDPKAFFSAIYQVLLGQERGPRFGSFAKMLGVRRVSELIAERIK
jgi:lysyl-tRNA synthetase class 1